MEILDLDGKCNA